MQLLKQPNAWSCLVASFAMVLNKTVEDLIQLIGHDGSEVVWKTHCKEWNNKAFSHQELIDVCFKLGHRVVTIECFPHSSHWADKEIIPVWDLDVAIERFQNYLKHNTGVCHGQTGFNSGHAIAWSHKDKKFYDPRGEIYSDFQEANFVPQYFYMVD